MALDPVCKMEVNEAGSPSAEYNGTMYYFCCDACKNNFEKNPEEHLAGHTSMHDHGHGHHGGHH